MEIEYSNEVRGKVHAYRFGAWEKQLIAKSLKPEIKKLERKIERIDNDPRNEGQATFLEEKIIIRAEILEIENIIKEFSNNS